MSDTTRIGSRSTSNSVRYRRALRIALLERLIRGGPATVAGLAVRAGLSPSIVRRLIGELMATRQVRAGANHVFEIDAAGEAGVCLDLGGTKFYGAVTNMAGEILAERTVNHHGTQGEASYALLEAMVADLLADPQASSRHVLGLGLGVPGVIRSADGLVVAATALAWNDFPLGDRLRGRFDLPVVVDNDVNLAALGEAWYGAGRATTSLVWINIGSGIGSGIVLNGRVYRGAAEMAGEIGYLLPGREFLSADYPGFGALELQAAGFGIAQRGTEAARAAGVPVDGEISARTVANAFRRGESWATQLMAETLDYLAIAIGAVACVLDPDMIVLGGGVMQSLSDFAQPLAERLAGKVPRVPPIVVSAMGPRAAVLGGMIGLLLESAG